MKLLYWKNSYCMVGSNGSPTCVCAAGYSGTNCQTCNFYYHKIII